MAAYIGSRRNFIDRIFWRFTPTEAEFQIAAMQAKIAAMKVRNTEIINSVTTWSNNRISRDEVLYQNATSIFELARLVKLYVKSLYGQDSPHFNQISRLEFKKRKLRNRCNFPRRASSI